MGKAKGLYKQTKRRSYGMQSCADCEEQFLARSHNARYCAQCRKEIDAARGRLRTVKRDKLRGFRRTRRQIARQNNAKVHFCTTCQIEVKGPAFFRWHKHEQRS